MIALIALASFVAADGGAEVETMTGKISVVGRNPVVSLEVGEEKTQLSGALCAELKRLSTFRVEVTGRTNGDV
ncbi:MAG: hypothetical protein AAF658_20335, partial [Myxococcota bacterium]